MQGGENMMSKVCEYVAVDVSKAMLDIAMPGANKVWPFDCPQGGRSG